MIWTPVTIDDWLGRQKTVLTDVRDATQKIINEVAKGGDKALYDLCLRFDKIKPEVLLVSEDEIEAAYEKVDAEVTEALIEAFTRISNFHELQKNKDLWLSTTESGITLGVKTTPLTRIGMYVPGGRACYPSTVLMCAAPAIVAGVREIVCCTPPPVNPLTLVALDIAGVSEIYTIGGAQAIAAMALGTESIKKVEKIVGPGNVFVTAAKQILRDSVEIDFPAGPSEIAVIADESARPDFIAADILAQSEHDPNSASLLITDSEEMAIETGRFIEQMLEKAERKEIIEAALKHSGYVLVPDIKKAVLVSNLIAPEHLSIQVKDPLSILNNIRNAGSIFVGPYAPVACGDYGSGTNHVLPTAGYSKIFSGLNVSHFTKTSTVQIINEDGLQEIGDIVETIARAEGLYAHANSIKIRRE